MIQYTNTGTHSSNLFLAIIQKGRALERAFHNAQWYGYIHIVMPAGNISRDTYTLDSTNAVRIIEVPLYTNFTL